MKYNKTIQLKNGKECILRNGTENDGQEVLDAFNLTHGETEYLTAYPDENSFTAEQEGAFLKGKLESENEIQLLAIVDHKVVGMASISSLGSFYKVSYRADFGVAVEKAYWNMGIGKALLDACIECARTAGYLQLELNVVSENEGAVAMYKKAGFVEFGRNPKGSRSRITGFQELVYMRLEL